MEIVSQCAWCEQILGTKEYASDIDEPDTISHTICPTCSATVLKEIHDGSHEMNDYYFIP